MKRFTQMVLALASVALVSGAVTAQAGLRPDDRANHGTGAVVFAGTNTSTRPDDRAWRGVGPAPVNEASLGIRPDDRATHGPGAVAALDVVRPDDRAWRGIGPAPVIVETESPASRIDGFDWADAGIGAAGALGIALLMMGLSALLLRRQRVTALT
jgi:hypothetical protein